MRLHELEMHNFLCYEDVKVPLSEQGLILVVGKNLDDPTASSNGSGKSSIPEAVMWCLFGSTSRGLRTKEVLKRGESECWVKLRGVFKKGKFLVTRSYPPHRVHLEVNGKQITAPTLSAMQQKIEEIFCTFDIFRNSVIFPQGKVQYFTSLTDAQKKEYLEDTLMIHSFVSAHERAREKFNDLRSRITEKEALLAEKKRRLVEITNQLNSQMEDYKRMSESKESRRRELRERIEQLSNSLPDTSDLLKEIEVLEDKREDQLKERSDLEAKLHNITAKSASLHYLIKDLRQKLKKVEDLEGQKCPTCLQEVDPATSAKIRKQLSSQEEKYLTELKELDERKKRLLAQIDSLGVSELSERIRTLRIQYEAECRKRREIENRITDAKLLLSEIDHSLSREEEAISFLRSERKKLLNQIEESEAEIQALQEDLKYLQFWVKGFSQKGLRGLVLRECLEVLTNLSNDYLSILTDGKISVSFSPVTQTSKGERETIQTVVNCPGGKIESVSGGERRRVDLAVLLALRKITAWRLGEDIETLFADEIFDALDEVGIERAIQLLEDEFTGKTVFVITHDNQLTGYFSKVLNVEKANGRSRISFQNFAVKQV
ncbi:MAG: AAA family ATPase [Methanosarcinales archaeon]